MWAVPAQRLRASSRYCWGFGQLISKSGSGHDDSMWLLVSELRTQATDPRTQIVRLAHELRSPHVAEELSMPHDTAGIPRELLEECPLRSTEANFLAIDVDAPILEIDRHVIIVKNRLLWCVAACPTKNRSDPGQKFVEVKRLRHIIVGP
jgi:hypothetical protein